MKDIILLHQEEVTRTGLADYLREAGCTVFASVATLSEAEAALAQRPDAVFITDVIVSGEVTFPLMRSSSCCIVFTGSENPTYLARAMSAGARDFLSATFDKDTLLKRVRAATLDDIQPGPSYLAMQGVLHCKDKIGISPADKLTPRECQTLRALSYGLSNEEISRVCDISIETVKEHVQHLLRKLGVEDRTQAAVWYVRTIELARTAKK